MKHLTGILVSLALFVSSCKEQTVKDALQSPTISTDKLAESDSLVVERYPNGNLKTETVLTNGVLNGIQKHYDENGTLIEHQEYDQGKKHGHWYRFFPNGNLEKYQYYIDEEVVYINANDSACRPMIDSGNAIVEIYDLGPDYSFGDTIEYFFFFAFPPCETRLLTITATDPSGTKTESKIDSFPSTRTDFRFVPTLTGKHLFEFDYRLTSKLDSGVVIHQFRDSISVGE